MLSLFVTVALLAEPSAPPLVPLDSVDPAPPLVEVTPSPPPAPAKVKQQAHQRPRVALIVSGAAVFALSYGTSVGIAALAENVRFANQQSSMWGLFIPLVGPVVALANPENGNVVTVSLLVFDVLSQAAGVVLTLFGVARGADAPQTAWLAPSIGLGRVGVVGRF